MEPFCQNVTKPSHQQLPVNEESVNALTEGHEIPFSVLTLSANTYYCVHVVVAFLPFFIIRMEMLFLALLILRHE